jgi:hypothetical protein
MGEVCRFASFVSEIGVHRHATSPVSMPRFPFRIIKDDRSPRFQRKRTFIDIMKNPNENCWIDSEERGHLSLASKLPERIVAASAGLSEELIARIV